MVNLLLGSGMTFAGTYWKWWVWLLALVGGFGELHRLATRSNRTIIDSVSSDEN